MTSLPRIGLPSQLVGCIPDGLPTPDAAAFGELDTALTRYYVLNGIVPGHVIGEKQAAADRLLFAHLRTPGEVEFRATIEFMHAASGLPWDWCVTWAYLDVFTQVQGGLMVFSDFKSREEYIEDTRLAAVDKLRGAA